jgi:hypothetical protein
MRDAKEKFAGSIFLSGSIPDPDRWEGDFDPLEITDAVAAFARACLTRGYRIVTAAHPTLAPLLLYVAAEFPAIKHAPVVIYQSLLFENVLPTATRRFEASGVGSLVWTEAVAGDQPRPGRWDESLAEMRTRMLTETEPIAAVFIGGMEGVREEYAMFKERYVNRPTFAVSRPGGEAARLHDPRADVHRSGDYDHGLSYPTLWSRFLDGLSPVI